MQGRGEKDGQEGRIYVGRIRKGKMHKGAQEGIM